MDPEESNSVCMGWVGLKGVEGGEDEFGMYGMREK